MGKLILMLLFVTSSTTMLSQELEKTESHDLKTSFLKSKSYSLVYPREALEKKIEGTITITFDVDSTCSLVNIRQDNELGYGCDEMVMKAMNKIEKDHKEDNGQKCNPIENISLPFEFKLPQ